MIQGGEGKCGALEEAIILVHNFDGCYIRRREVSFEYVMYPVKLWI